MTAPVHNRRRFPFRGACLALLLLPAAAAGQQSGQPLTMEIPGEPPELVDRVVAVAGDSVIFLSEVTAEMVLLAAQGAPFPQDPDSLREAAREVLDQMINMQLLLQDAARDTLLELDASATDARVQAQIDAVQQQLGGADGLQAALEADGMTLTEYRETLRRRISDNLMRDLYLRARIQDLPPVAVTEAEMRDFFEAQRAALQQRPEILALEHVVIPVIAPDSMWARARTEIDSLRAQLLAGADFAELATAASDDQGTALNGGDLGWFRRGTMVTEFDRVAFSLPDNQVSEPFRSPYGWHVIRVDRQRPGEVKARHILIRPESGPDDLGDAMERAREIAARMEAGESVDSLAVEYGHFDRIPTVFPRASREFIANNLPPEYGPALADADEGEVVEPFQVNLNGPYIAIVKVPEIREAGEFTFEDVEDQIREGLAQQKNLERIWQRLRDRSYVDIRF